MNVQIRPLRPVDIGPLTQIERRAFATLWPPTPFKRDLDNDQARYLVAWEPKPADFPVNGNTGYDSSVISSDSNLVKRFLGSFNIRRFSDHHSNDLDYSVLGFVGLMFIAGEAHITAIAVDQPHRGKGIGELLLMSAIELARKVQATVVSLEARASNHVAQSLYEKYGFENVGIRRGYYTDNREDATIMTTNALSSPGYQNRFEELRDSYVQRYGEIIIDLV